MKNKKCIILSRVSTLQQDLVQQTEQLFEDAVHYGYDRKNVILIEDKESAIKLEESERNGLNKMKEYIESDSSIDCVFIWEITRVSRKLQMLYSIRDYLQEHHVQLICHTPQFTLFNDDWTISQTSNMVFAMFAVIAESEMQVKKQRMMRGKLKKISEGKYVGGFICFGYKTDNNKDKNIVVDEQTSQVVKKVFNMYTEQNLSIRQIAEELIQTGEIWHDSVINANSFISLMLKNPAYIGHSTKEKNRGHIKYGLVYPAIITEEQFNKAKEIANKKNRNLNKTEYYTDNIYYSKGLLYIKHGETVSKMSAIKSVLLYRFLDQETRKGYSMNINLMDSIVWYLAKQNRMKYSSMTVSELKKELNDEKKTLMKKILTSERQISEMNSQIEIIETRIIKGRLSQEKGDAMEDELIRKIKTLQSEQDKWKYKVNQIQEQLNQANVNTYKKDLNNVTDEQERKAIINEEIKKVVIMSQAWTNHNLTTYNIQVQFRNRTENYIVRSSNHVKGLYDCNDNLIEDFEYIVRFTRKR